MIKSLYLYADKLVKEPYVNKSQATFIKTRTILTSSPVGSGHNTQPTNQRIAFNIVVIPFSHQQSKLLNLSIL